MSGVQSVGSGVKLEIDSTENPQATFTWADIPGNTARTRLFYLIRLECS